MSCQRKLVIFLIASCYLLCIYVVATPPSFDSSNDELHAHSSNYVRQISSLSSLQHRSRVGHEASGRSSWTDQSIQQGLLSSTDENAATSRTPRRDPTPLGMSYLEEMSIIQKNLPKIDNPSARYEWEKALFSAKMIVKILRDAVADIPMWMRAAQKDRRDGIDIGTAMLQDRYPPRLAALCFLAGGALQCLGYLASVGSVVHHCLLALGESVCMASHLVKIPFRLKEKAKEINTDQCSHPLEGMEMLRPFIGERSYRHLRTAYEALREKRFKQGPGCWQLSAAEKSALKEAEKHFLTQYQQRRDQTKAFANWSPLYEQFGSILDEPEP